MRSRSRRAILRMGLAGAAVLVVPRGAHAQTPAGQAGQEGTPDTRLVDPYTGGIPLVFPLIAGGYVTPVLDNWHAARDGDAYPWSHRLVASQRAHDGVDVFPLPDEPVPTVYAPLPGTVAAVCLRPDNRLDAPLTYRVSGKTPPPWDYSQAVDTVSNLPLYGNCVWLISTDAASAGYVLFLCHLQYEPLIDALRPDQPVDTDTPLGVVGDTGNAEGTPQLHVELHYPGDFGFRCRRCRPPTLLTGFSPFASLRDAAPRSSG
jgi:hypothetical protein